MTRIDPTAVLRRQVDQVNADAAASGMPFGRKLGDVWRESFFQYIATITFTANENQRATIPIQYDAHFLCVSSYYDTSAQTGGNFGTGLAAGGSLVLLTDGGTQRDLANSAVPSNALFGTAQNPYVWPYTHLFRAGSFIGISATGTTGAAQTVRFVFGGFKVPSS